MSALAESQPGLAPYPRESDVTLLLAHDPLCFPGDLSAPGVRAVQSGWVSRPFCVPLRPCLSLAPSREPRPHVLVRCGPMSPPWGPQSQSGSLGGTLTALAS